MTLLLAGVPAASAQDHCITTAPGQVQVNLPGGSEASLDVAADGQLVLHIGETDDPCGGATRDSTQSVTVTVTGQDADETFVVDHNGPGGPFTQQFTVDLGQGENTVGVQGTNGGDRIAATSTTVLGSNQTSIEMEMYDPDLDRREPSEGFISGAG
ncbi:MAG: hypothetical protein ACRDHM_07070, partial [Actinomycetota bacterium]